MNTYLANAFAANNMSSWVSAVGTIAAVIVALYLARMSSRREFRQARSTATLMAARIAPLLSLDAETVASAARNAQYRREDKVSNRVPNIAQALRKLKFVPENAVLLALTPLDATCGHQISRAYGLLSRLAAEIDAGQDHSYRSAADVNQWDDMLCEASALLTRAANTCANQGHGDSPLK